MHRHKGRGVVTKSVDEYIKEVELQLNKQEHYKKLRKGPTETNSKLLNDTMQRFKETKLHKDSIAKRLKIAHLKTSKLYLRPKNHKKDKIGRPAVFSVNFNMSRISDDVDYHLNRLRKQYHYM